MILQLNALNSEKFVWMKSISFYFKRLHRCGDLKVHSLTPPCTTADSIRLPSARESVDIKLVPTTSHLALLSGA